MPNIFACLFSLWIAWQSPPAAAPEPLYRLQPGDAVDIRLFFNPELNETVAIRPDGRISLQLVGDVTLAGKTIPEVTAELEQLFSKEVRTPKVTIQIRAFASQKIFVTGEVVRPGPITLPGNMTIVEALGEAGGVKNTGDRNLVVLIRKGADGKPEGRKLIVAQKGVLTADAGRALSPFDVVVVPESKIARVDRWVDQHIRQLIPINVSAGFTYLLQSVPGAQAIPII